MIDLDDSVFVFPLSFIPRSTGYQTHEVSVLNAIPFVTYSFHNAEKVDGTVSVRAEKVVLVPSQSVEGGKPQVSMGNKNIVMWYSTRIHECYRKNCERFSVTSTEVRTLLP